MDAVHPFLTSILPVRVVLGQEELIRKLSGNSYQQTEELKALCSWGYQVEIPQSLLQEDALVFGEHLASTPFRKRLYLVSGWGQQYFRC